MSGAMLARVISCALNRLRRSLSAVRNGCTNTTSARWRTAGSALASAVIAVASRRAAAGGAGEPIDNIDGGIDHADDLRVGRRRTGGGRIERGIERLCRVLDD